MLRPREKPSSAPSHYSRLLGGPFPGHDESHLRELSLRMKEVPPNRRGRLRRGDLAPSGFVYLGQFLDHDLTCDDTRLADPRRGARENKKLSHAAIGPGKRLWRPT